MTHQPSSPLVPGALTELETFMAQALAMELDAAQRYAEFADMMDTHNSPDVAGWFRKMAVIEGKHATQIMAEMGWSDAPHVVNAPVFEGFETPESAPVDQMHCLM